MGLIKRGQIHVGEERILSEAPLGYASGGPGDGPTPRSPAELTAEELKLLGPVRDEAEKIIERAEEQAAEVLREAEREARTIQEQAKQTGYVEAQQKAQRELATQSAQILEVMNAAAKERKKIIADAEGEILRLALKAAEQIVKSEVSLHRDVCLNIVSEAISRVSDREQMIVHVSKDDLENVKRLKDKISSMVDGIKQLSILEDPTVDPGGVIIETNLGFVDARISTKLQAIELAVQKVQGGDS